MPLRLAMLSKIRLIFLFYVVVLGALILTLGNRERVRSLLTKSEDSLRVESSDGMASKSLLRTTESSRISLETISTAVDTKTKSTPSKYMITLVGIWDKLNITGIRMPSVEQLRCSDVLCSEFVAESNLNCAKKVKVQPAQRVIPRCRFQNGSLKPLVVIQSFPGSGNTWARQLLEKSTGICTGIYNRHNSCSPTQCMGRQNIEVKC